jgi:hypothetical protein
MTTRGLTLLAAAAFATAPFPALARSSGFVLANGTASAMESVSIRRFRSGAWQALAVSPRPGQRVNLPFNDEDCAFDIRATFAGAGSVVWSAVNICEAKAVILNRDGSGAAWVDYE